MNTIFDWRVNVEKESKVHRHRGVIAVYSAIGLLAFLGISALAVDMGFRYYRRAQAQSTADGAALAAAWSLPNLTKATQWAQHVAGKNGYNINVPGTIVNVTHPYNNNSSLLRVDVTRPEPFFFGGLLNPGGRNVGATAVAKLITDVDFDISGGGSYGKNGPVNLSLFGPDGLYSYGDCYSPYWLNNGDRNPLNVNFTGYDFGVQMPDVSTYNAQYGTNMLQVQIYDPDCYNADGSVDANGVPDAQGDIYIDEFRTPSGGNPSSANRQAYATTTRYKLFYEYIDGNGDFQRTPVVASNGSDDGVSVGWNDAYDQKWTSFPDLQIDLTSPIFQNPGRLVLNVLSTAGSSENGFNLRAGPPDTDQNYVNRTTDDAWVTNYAQASNPSRSEVSAIGQMPMNFNQDSQQVEVTLGSVPSKAAGGTLTINKFDTDVGSRSVIYEYLPTGIDPSVEANWTASAVRPQVVGQSTPGAGLLSTNGTFQPDQIRLPPNYPGGTWRAIYQAGRQDTSVWTMSYEASGLGPPDQVFLIK